VAAIQGGGLGRVFGAMVWEFCFQDKYTRLWGAVLKIVGHTCGITGILRLIPGILNSWVGWRQNILGAIV